MSSVLNLVYLSLNKNKKKKCQSKKTLGVSSGLVRVGANCERLHRKARTRATKEEVVK